MDFIDYTNGADLEDAVRRRMVELRVAEQDAKDILTLLGPLGTKGEAGQYHRDHCLRVGLVASSIAEALEMNAKALLFAGILHDVGKALVPACTLGATTRWTDEDRAAMEAHVLDGFRMLRDRFDFTAHVISWHHCFQSHSYPIEQPSTLRPFSQETLEKTKSYGRVLALADVFDALHRVNTATAGARLSHEEIVQRLRHMSPDMAGTVDLLVDRSIWPFKAQRPLDRMASEAREALIEQVADLNVWLITDRFIDGVLRACPYCCRYEEGGHAEHCDIGRVIALARRLLGREDAKSTAEAPPGQAATGSPPPGAEPGSSAPGSGSPTVIGSKNSKTE